MVDRTGELDLKGATIEQLDNPGARGRAGLATAHYVMATGPIFPHDPVPDDIQQGQLGDCYMLTAVISVLAQPGGPAAVAGMMKEQGGRVVVRLYDKSNKPHYCSIEKSIRRNAEKHNGGALWATFLEKAYAAASFVEENKKPDGKPKGKVQVGYAKLNRGHSSDVYQVLFGEDARKLGIGQDSFGGGSGDNYVFGRLWHWNPGEKLTDGERASFTQKIFGGDAELFNRFILWRTHHVVQQWDTLIDAHGDIKDKKGQTLRRRTMRIEDLRQFLTSNGLEDRVAAVLVSFCEAKRLLPSKRGGGVYTQQQLDLYNRIQTALAARKPVSLGTTKQMAAKATGKGKSAGEEIAKGLAGGHAYAVMSVRDETAAPYRKWLRIRNPWGETGRAYIAGNGNTLKAVETKEGEFDLELSDLTKRFNNVYIAGTALV